MHLGVGNIPPPIPPQCSKVEDGRNCRSFINALLLCGLNLKQMGQDALAKIQCEHADLHRAFHFKYGNAETGPGHCVWWSSRNVIPEILEAES